MASAAAETEELIDCVQLSEACHLSALGDTCLALLARRLAAAGPFWHEQVSQEQLAECNPESLASLVCKMAGTVHAGAFEPPSECTASCCRAVPACTCLHLLLRL